MTEQIMGLTCYKFWQKNTWRYWTWNRIDKKLNIKKERAVGMYFPGPDDIDRRIATKNHKFKNQNLIAVDVNNNNIKSIKTNGYPAIHADLGTLIAHWKGDPKIDFLNADFCCGLNKEILWQFTFDLIFSAGLAEECVVALNFLRGRDAAYNPIRESYKGWEEIYKEKHRGKLFYEYFIINYWAAFNIMQDNNFAFCIDIGSDETADFISTIVDRYGDNNIYNIKQGILDKELMELGHYQYFISQPSYWQYKSEVGNLYMDSVVFKINSLNKGCITFKNKHYGPQIAALKAWRTMRST